MTKTRASNQGSGFKEVSLFPGEHSPGMSSEASNSPATSPGIYHQLTWTKSESSMGLVSPDLKSKSPRSQIRFSRNATDYHTEHGLRTARWGLTWPTPVLMTTMYFLGLLGAIVHHVFNTVLDGRQADDQQWMQRIANALAFFTKVCLVGCIASAYQQRVWHSLRTKAFTIAAIDGLFSACESLMSLLDFEILLKAKICSMLVIFAWLIPLSAIFAPGTLTTVQEAVNSSSLCNVSSLNFAQEIPYDFHKDMALSLSVYSIGSDGNYIFQSPSDAALRIASLSLLSSEPLQIPSPCGGNYNCTYELKYFGPGYKCEELTKDEEGAPVSFSDIVPEGNLLYKAASDIQEDTFGRAKDKWSILPATNAAYGTLGSEPALYIGYATNTSQLSNNNPKWHYTMQNHVMKCTHYNTTYKRPMQFNNLHMEAHNGTSEYISPLIPSGQSRAPSYPQYKELAAYHALGFLFRSQLAGAVERDNDTSIGITQNSTRVMQTTLLKSAEYMPVSDNFPQAVENLYADLVQSLLSNNELVAIANILAPCTKSRQAQVWEYEPKYLLLSYGLSVLAATIALFVGYQSCFVNGICMDLSFSSILVTTRNRSLDLLAEGCCLGQRPQPPELQHTKIVFGEVGQALDGQIAHAAFGTVNEISPIIVGKKYV